MNEILRAQRDQALGQSLKSKLSQPIAPCTDPQVSFSPTVKKRPPLSPETALSLQLPLPSSDLLTFQICPHMHPIPGGPREHRAWKMFLQSWRGLPRNHVELYVCHHENHLVRGKADLCPGPTHR